MKTSMRKLFASQINITRRIYDVSATITPWTDEQPFGQALYLPSVNDLGLWRVRVKVSNSKTTFIKSHAYTSVGWLGNPHRPQLHSVHHSFPSTTHPWNSRRF